MKIFIKPIFCIMTLLLVSGCAIKPKPFSSIEAHHNAAQLKQDVHVQQEALPDELSIDEAIARTIKYNLEHRVKLFEVAMKQNQFDLAMFDLLPDVAAKGEATERSNDDASVSKNLSTGTKSSDYTTSDDRSKRTGDISLSWNVLDLGISYYTAHQQANRFLIAKEQQRKVVQNLVGETREAFFKALVAQELETDVNLTLQQAEEALAKAQTIEAERLRPLEEILVYQKNMLQLIKQLEDLRRELTLAKTQLAALMNLDAASLPKLQTPSWYGSLRQVELTQDKLEEYAFAHRPEIFEWGYQRRITALEARKAILDLVPGIGVKLSSEYSSNSYDLHSVWQQASVHVAYNLMNILRYPAKKRMLTAQEDVEFSQGLAMGMAVLAQVNLARQQHEFAMIGFRRADQLAGVEKRLKELATKQVQQRQGIFLDTVQKSVAAIAGKMNREQALIGYYKALSNVYTSIGVDYMDYAALPQNLGDLTDVVAKANQLLWASGELGPILSTPAPTVMVEAVQ